MHRAGVDRRARQAMVARALVDHRDRVTGLDTHRARRDAVVVDGDGRLAREVEAGAVVRAGNGSPFVRASGSEPGDCKHERDRGDTSEPTHGKSTVVDTWARERASHLASLVDRALPDERLTADELGFCCWNDGGAVLGLPSGDGAVAVSVADEGPRRIGFVKLVVVDPDAQRRGHGRALVEAAQKWAF